MSNNNNESRPHFKPGAVKYTKGYGRKVFFSKLITATIVLLSLVAIGLTVFTYVKQPVRTEDGLIQAKPIRNRTPEIGERVLVSESEKHNMFTPVNQAIFVQDVYEAEIIAGPYGEIKKPVDNFVVVYASETTSVNLEIDLEDSDEKYLDREYVVREIDASGKYPDKEDRIVKLKDILGNSK